MDDREEREVARGLRHGRCEAWHALYEAYCRQVWHLVGRLMGSDSADVADVVQETFLAAARSARGYDAARGSLWSWLVGIARRHVALHYRKQRRHDLCVGGCVLRECGSGHDDEPHRERERNNRHKWQRNW